MDFKLLYVLITPCAEVGVSSHTTLESDWSHKSEDLIMLDYTLGYAFY